MNERDLERVVSFLVDFNVVRRLLSSLDHENILNDSAYTRKNHDIRRVRLVDFFN
jgi:hypothetical protein